MISAAQSLSESVGVQPACCTLNVSRATYYRRLSPVVEHEDQRRPPLKLSEEESQEALELLRSPRFVDSSPRQVWATLLDDDQRYICSVRTLYRLLASCGESRERRNQLRLPESFQRPSSDHWNTAQGSLDQSAEDRGGALPSPS